MKIAHCPFKGDLSIDAIFIPSSLSLDSPFKPVAAGGMVGIYEF